MTHAKAASRASIDIALAAFRQKFPTFETTQSLDLLRATEYARLDRQQQVYLDYTGGGHYAESQLRDYFKLLHNKVFGNPHSTNPASQAMTTLVEQARSYVLDYFRASPDEYIAIFTPNATAALKLVGESYPFASGGQYLLTFDNHNAVNGIREFAQAKGASVSYVPVEPPDMRVNEARLPLAGTGHRTATPVRLSRPVQRHRCPASSRVDCPGAAQGWDVLVDAPPLSPPIAWISPNGTRISSPSPSIRCSASPRASAAYWLASPRWPNCTVPGFPGERSRSLPSSLPMPPALDFT